MESTFMGYYLHLYVLLQQGLYCTTSDGDKNKKVVSAICHAGWVLASAGIIKGKKVTCFAGIKDDVINAGAKYSDEEVVVDGNIITSRKPGDLGAFCREIIKALSK